MENSIVVIDTTTHSELAAIQAGKHNNALLYLVTGRTPKDVLRSRRIRGGDETAYIPGWWFQEQLNALFGGMWSFVIGERNVDLEHNQVVVSGELIITIANGQVVKRPGTGGAEIDRYNEDIHRKDHQGRDIPAIIVHKRGDIVDLADDIKSAETEALSRAARWLGFGADVYNQRREK